MADVNDGGPASNKSLRDYLAAKAMGGILAASALNNTYDGSVEDAKDTYIDRIATVAYQVSDAMLKARAGNVTPPQ
jgi:hypothetical protein